MSASDVVDILATPLLGIVPDDENVVVSTNQGEPLVGKDCPAGTGGHSSQCGGSYSRRGSHPGWVLPDRGSDPDPRARRTRIHAQREAASY